MLNPTGITIDASHWVREIGRGAKGARDLSRDDAQLLFGAMLDGTIDALQLGALLIGLRIKGESDEELIGFKAALDARTPQLSLAVPQPRLVVIPSYNGARRHANLMPLLACLLAREGIPVLIHTRYDFATRVNPSALFAALNIPNANSLAAANDLLNQQRIACIDLSVLLPKLDTLLALRSRLGLRNSAHTLVKLLDPLRGASVRVVAVTHPEYVSKMREFLCRDAAYALLLRGTEGEAYANPKRRPQIESFVAGNHRIACLAEEASGMLVDEWQDGADNLASAALIRAMLAGEIAIPEPILQQVAALKQLV
jgi:anthranilate phosphoribosyltransferase